MSFLARFMHPDIKQLKASRDVDGLIRALSNWSSEVRFDAIDALGYVGDGRAFRPLVALARSEGYGEEEHKEIMDRVRLALRKMAPSAAEAICEVLREEREPSVLLWAVRLAGDSGNACAVQPLIDILDERNPGGPWGTQLAAAAAYSLIELGELATKPLLRAIANRRAADALGHILNSTKAPQAIEEVCAALKNENSIVRQHAALALRVVGDTRTIDALRSALEDDDVQVRLAAVSTLSHFSDPAAVGALESALEDADVQVRVAAAEALGRVNNIRAFEALRCAVEHGNSVVRVAAVGALRSHSDIPAVEALRFEMLQSTLEDDDVQVRLAAVSTLSHFSDPAAVGALESALEDADVQVRVAAAEALGHIGNAQAIEVLRSAVKHADGQVLHSASLALDMALTRLEVVSPEVKARLLGAPRADLGLRYTTLDKPSSIAFTTPGDRIMIKCPNTGKPVPIGIRVVPPWTFETMVFAGAPIKCPECRQEHAWAMEDCFLEGTEPR